MRKICIKFDDKFLSFFDSFKLHQFVRKLRSSSEAALIRQLIPSDQTKKSKTMESNDGRSQTSMKSKASRNCGAVAESGIESTTSGYSTTSQKPTKGTQNRRGHSSKKEEKRQHGSKTQNNAIAPPPSAPVPPAPKKKEEVEISDKDYKKCLLIVLIIQTFLLMVCLILAVVLAILEVVPLSLLGGFLGLFILQIIPYFAVYISAGSKSFNL